MSCSIESRVRAVAARMNLLDWRGELVPLDSLTAVDLVLELERELDVRIPSATLRPEYFHSLSALHTWLVDVGRV